MVIKLNFLLTMLFLVAFIHRQSFNRSCFSYDNGDTFTGSFRSDKRYGYGKLKCRSEFGSHRQGFLEEMRILNGPGDDEPCVTWNENQELDQFYYDCDEKYYSDCERLDSYIMLRRLYPFLILRYCLQ